METLPSQIPVPVVYRHTEVDTWIATCYLENKPLQAAGTLEDNAQS